MGDHIEKNDLVCRAKLAVKAGAPPLTGRGKDPDRYTPDDLKTYLRMCEAHFARLEGGPPAEQEPVEENELEPSPIKGTDEECPKPTASFRNKNTVFVPSRAKMGIM